MRQLEIRTRRMVNDSMAGAYHSVFKGRGMDFDEVREYSPGDEVRTIDWNVTARAGRPFVKKFTEERELTIFLVVDISASGNFGSGAMAKRDLAAEVASVLAFSAIRNSDKVGLILYTDRIERYLPPKKGRRHVLRVVRDILYHEPRAAAPTPSRRSTSSNRRAAPARGGVPDLGFPDAGRSRPPSARRCAARSARPTAVTISSRCTSRIRASRSFPTSASSRSRMRKPARSSNSTPAAPRCASASRSCPLERARRLRGDLRAEGVDTVQLRTDMPYIPPLQRFFKSRGRRRV